jgi:hypothetical protein
MDLECAILLMCVLWQYWKDAGFEAEQGKCGEGQIKSFCCENWIEVAVIVCD